MQMKEVAKDLEKDVSEMKKLAGLREGDDAKQKMLADIGRVLMDKATKQKDDNTANKMSSVGDLLTQYGTPFGPKNAKEVADQADVPMDVLQRMVTYGKKHLNK